MKLSNGTQATKGWDQKAGPSGHNVKVLILAIAGTGMFTFHAIIPALYPFW